MSKPGMILFKDFVWFVLKKVSAELNFVTVFSCECKICCQSKLKTETCGIELSFHFIEQGELVSFNSKQSH